MANITINNIKLVGISACVPKQVEKNTELNQFSNEEIDKLIKSLDDVNSIFLIFSMDTNDGHWR